MSEQRTKEQPAWPVREDCGNCHMCLVGKFDPGSDIPIRFTRMILCPTCGNKRCPKATDHEMTCTGSNEPGQEGSVYVP
jgi:hypothetical protein